MQKYADSMDGTARMIGSSGANHRRTRSLTERTGVVNIVLSGRLRIHRSPQEHCTVLVAATKGRAVQAGLLRFRLVGETLEDRC